MYTVKTVLFLSNRLQSFKYENNSFSASCFPREHFIATHAAVREPRPSSACIGNFRQVQVPRAFIIHKSGVCDRCRNILFVATSVSQSHVSFGINAIFRCRIIIKSVKGYWTVRGLGSINDREQKAEVRSQTWRTHAVVESITSSAASFRWLSYTIWFWCQKK